MQLVTLGGVVFKSQSLKTIFNEFFIGQISSVCNAFCQSCKLAYEVKFLQRIYWCAKFINL